MAVRYSKNDIRRFREVCESHLLFAPDEQLAMIMKARGWPAGIALPPAIKPGIITIDRSKPFDFAKFGLNGCSIWRGPLGGGGLSGDEEQDERSLALAQIELSKVRFENCLKNREVRVGGEMRLLRLKATGRIRLDIKVFEALWDNQDLIPENWEAQVDGQATFIFFDGTVLRFPGGERSVVFLSHAGRRQWWWSHRQLAFGWFNTYLSAVLEN